MTFFRNLALVFLSNTGTMVLGLLTGTLLARTLGPTGRGLMTTVLIWPAILVWAGGMSLGYATMFYGASEPEHRESLFANSCWVALVLGSLIGVVAVFAVPRLVPLTPQQHLLLTISFLTLAVGVWSDYVTSLLFSTSRFDRLGVVRTAGPTVTAIGLGALWGLHHLTVTSAVLATWAGGWVQLGLALRFLAQEGYVGLQPDWGLLRRSFSYSSRIHVGTLAGLANGRMDQLLMTALVAPKALGLYAFAVTFAELLKQVAGTISMALFPKAAGEVNEAVRRSLAVRTARWTLLSSSVCAGGMFALAPVLIHLIWGSRFLEAVPTARVLLPGTVVLSLAGTMTTSLNACGRPGVGTVAEVVSLVIMMPLLWLLLPRMGIFGAGLASTVGYTANLLVVMFYFARHFGAESLGEMRPTRQDWTDVRTVAQALTGRLRRQPAA